jgi:glycosyltransferase involved in cell wall biosynthesis
MAGYDVTLIGPSSTVRDDGYGVKLRIVSVPRNRHERMTKTIGEVYRAAVEEDAEIYHFHDPELMPIAMLLKLLGKKVIYDVHEDYGSTMRKQWIPKPLQGIASMTVRASEATLGRACDRIVAATPRIADLFQAGMTSVVQNFPRSDEFDIEQGQPYREREPIVAYVGYLADIRGLREMSEAIRLVNAEIPAKLLLAGKMISGMQSAAFCAGNQVEALGFLDRSHISKLLSRAKIGIVVYHPTPNYYPGQPTKLLEYMAAGLPVVASDFPFYRRVVESTGCGILVNPLQPTKIAEALLWLLRNEEQASEMGRRGRQAVLERYNWEQEAKCLISAYEAV